MSLQGFRTFDTGKNMVNFKNVYDDRSVTRIVNAVGPGGRTCTGDIVVGKPLVLRVKAAIFCDLYCPQLVNIDRWS